MKILLDTQIALWMWTDDSRLTSSHRKLLGETGHEFFYHQVSTWEIQIKFDLGKLPLPRPPSEVLPKWIAESGLRSKPIEDRAIFLLGNLPAIHRDPFDRLLIAHAVANGWSILTADETVKQYPVLTC
ncbi:type II toxin-antitoxin system VapC family toxin [Opitutaceae bacterium]|nr:type II toxin-antitoxin system VapC family toxin [Opitutaceae bacterium]